MASPEITLTHLDEPLFDGADATKRDLVDYLEAVADRIVPVLTGRPLSVIRVRAGQRPFMQKNLPDYAPPWIKTASLGHPGNLGGRETWEDAGSWRHRRSTPMSCVNAR
ncbi:MAG TPA: hypothetical protein VGG16_21800 [Streptosporangiaceae bacterium]|jgi:DNA primase